MDPHEEFFVTGSADGDIKVKKFNFESFEITCNFTISNFYFFHSGVGISCADEFTAFLLPRRA